MMSELTDLEICKSIAEIEHGRAYIDGDDTGNFINLNHPMSDRGGESYNPLTDDALCFQLMVKHKADFIPYYRDEYRAQIKSIYMVSKSPNRAICLAIIESKALLHQG